MKKILFLLFSFLIVSSVLLFENCGTDSPKPEGSWTDADKQSYDQAVNIQDEIGDNLDDWFQSMDSLAAIEKAYDAFINSENVSSAVKNSQGIAVQYTNGMRGGLFLSPEDDKSEVGEFEKLSPNSASEEGLKSLVNKKKMILINPHYYERSYYTDQIRNITGNNMSKAGIELSTFYKNEEATVDRFTELSGYGVIQIYSHGWAWPKETNITDVYLLTGETANEATSAKYWDELKTGNIPVLKVGAVSNKYYVSPKFIRDHNDFSKDTVLFYGGFCYSFLGDWPDIIDDFGDGAYMGFDWSVYTHKNANWAVNSMFYLTDTTANQPITLQQWMVGSEIEKSYWNEEDQRTVHIHYTGDGNLKLWDDISVRLIPLSQDGAPVSLPGEAGTAYPFRCEVNSASSDLEFIWDIGDGSSPVSASNEVNITWSEEGSYVLSVTVKNSSSGVVIGTANLNVTIGTETNEIIDILKQCNYTVVYFWGKAINHWEFADCSWSVDGQLDWNGLNFSGSSSMNGLTKSITGTVSSDGQRISFTVVKEGDLLGYDRQIRLAMTVENFPLKSYVYNQVVYEIDPPGGTSYVTNLEGYVTSDDNTYTFSSSKYFSNTSISHMR